MNLGGQSEKSMAVFHPGASWWCDACLQECRNMDDCDVPGGRWKTKFSQFGLWISAFISRAGMLAATVVVCLMVMLMGDFCADSDARTSGLREYNWLLVRRRRLLADIDRLQVDIGKACAGADSVAPCELERRLTDLYAELDDIMVKISSLEQTLGLQPGV